MTNEEYLYWISTIYYKIPKAVKKLMTVFPEAEEAYKAPEGALREIEGIGERDLDLMISSRVDKKIQSDLERIKKTGMKFIGRNDSSFPEKLKQIPESPMFLYYKGSLPDPDVPSAGMVGARACSGYGREYALKYASQLARENIQVISGMAAGIDSSCARGALDIGGKTFAVLGCGADVIYPRENIELYYEIITSGGGIISEFPPGTAPVGWHFPYRNRIISGLSDILIVIEAGKRSGTLSTAMHALDQGKDIWALPGRVDDRMSEGCNELISDGAGILTDINRVISALGKGAGRPTSRVKEPEDVEGPLSDKMIIQKIVRYEPVNLREIVDKSGISPKRVTEIISDMEIEGTIVRYPGDCYALR